MKQEQKTFYIKTFGCQMNVADTERMSVMLSDMGAKESLDPKTADYVILNGCEVREKAVNKALSSLGELKEINKNQIIGMGGCVGQLEGKKLFSRNKHLNFVFGTDNIDRLPEIIYEVENGSEKVLFNDFDPRTEDYSTETKVFHKSSSAFVNIMKGCDKFCSYCIVPFTRGREKSRKIAEIIEDVKRLLLLDVKEITLLGQNVNSFGKGNNETFPELLRKVDELKRLGLKRLRYTSSHPLDFSDDLINCYGELETLCDQLHLPVQTGSNAVLQKMFRHYKIERYYDQIGKWRKRCPGGSLTTDIIVGFPTETEEDFQMTMKLLEDMRFDQVYSFNYSPRPGTKAAKLKDDVPLREKKRRLNIFQDRAVEIANEINQKFIGQIVEVLVEKKTKPLKNSTWKNVFAGRTTSGKLVNFPYDGPRELVGKFCQVEIKKATGLALTGEMATIH